MTNKNLIVRYIPTHEEAIEDAKFLLEGYVTKVRCDLCGYRLAWRNDEEMKKVKGCVCSDDPSWYFESMSNLTYQDVVDVWNEMFGKIFTKWTFDQFFGAIQAKQLMNRMKTKQEIEKLQKKR